MALALEGFSIREYAANMRGVDFDKCWPFAVDGGGTRSLPQMSVRKFRFWSTEAKDVLSSNLSSGEEKDEGFQAVNTRSAATPSKGKQRTPRKRSIVELFALAPPVEAADDGGGGDGLNELRGDGGEEMMEEGSKRGKTAKKKKIKKKLLMGKEAKRKKKKRPKAEICASKKDKLKKATSSSRTFHSHQSSTHKLLSRKKTKSTVNAGKRSACTKNLAKNHKLKVLQPLKSISKKKRKSATILQRCKVLKGAKRDPTRVADSGTNAGGNLVNVSQSEQHTTFSVNDLVGKSSSISAIDIPKLRSLCKIFSDVLAASSALDTAGEIDDLQVACVAQAEKISDSNVARNLAGRRGGTSSEYGQLPESHRDSMPPSLRNASNNSYSERQRGSVSISEEENHTVNIHNDVDHVSLRTSTLSAKRHLDNPKTTSSVTEGSNSNSDGQVKDFPLVNSAASLATTIEMSTSKSEPTGLLSFIRNPIIPQSISCMEESRLQPQLPTKPFTSSYQQVTEFHPVHHLPSRLTEDGYSSVGQSVLTNPDNYSGEGFVGLPLNSRGELIHLHSGAKFASNELNKRPNVIQGSNNSYPVPSYVEPRLGMKHVQVMKRNLPGATMNQKDLLSWLQQPYLHASKPAVSDISFTTSQSSERYGVQANSRNKNFLRDFHPREVSCNGCWEDSRTRNYLDRVNFRAERFENNVSQPNMTMRLMGTDVTVGRTDERSQGYEDGRKWTDKEVTTDYHPPIRASDWSFPQHRMQQQWAAQQSSGKMKDNFFYPLDVSTNFCPVPAVAPRLGVMNLHGQPQWVSRGGTSSTTANHLMKVDLFTHPSNMQASLDGTSESIVTSIPGTMSGNMERQIPVVVSDSSKAYQHMFPNSTHCKEIQGISYSTASSFHPPFLYQETRSSTQPALTQTSQHPLPQWLLNAKQQTKGQEYSCSCYSHPVASHHHYSKARPSLFPLPSPPPTSTMNFPVHATTSHMNGFCTTSFVQSSFTPSCKSSRTRTIVDNSWRNDMMNKGVTNFNFTYLKNLDSVAKTKKRPAPNGDEVMRPAKRPYQKQQEDISALANSKPAEQTVIPPDVHSSEMNNEKECLKSPSYSCSLSVDSGFRSRPIKLSAGAKHILKPSKDVNQDNARPTHSTIPFSIMNSPSKIPGPQMKAAEIYKL